MPFRFDVIAAPLLNEGMAGSPPPPNSPAHPTRHLSPIVPGNLTPNLQEGQAPNCREAIWDETFSLKATETSAPTYPGEEMHGQWWGKIGCSQTPAGERLEINPAGLRFGSPF